MGVSKILTFITILAILFLTSNAASIEADDQSEFSYASGSTTGPEHWGELHTEWATCGTGQLQSPIDLSDARVVIQPQLGELNLAYRPSDAVMKNRGHDIMIEWPGAAGGILLNGTEYALKQIHWHSPSEHTLNGERFSLELHMVHQSPEGKIAVVGVLYTIGQPDSFLAKKESSINKLKDQPETVEEKVGLVHLMEINIGDAQYYRYEGSLTTPPCTEGVVWTIVTQIHTVSEEQVRLLQESVHDGFEMNARPSQMVNDRVIGFYRPRKMKF